MAKKRSGETPLNAGKDAAGRDHGLAPAASVGRDWSETLNLPKTDFPMKAGLPEHEPQLLERWRRLGLYERQRELSRGREKFVLHDGPPYANGNIHLGHALNKILKDVIARSQQMLGKDSNYVPGWDCHGLPIEWKIEERYRAEGKDKDEVPILEFRRECREFAQSWVEVQRGEFMRLGVEGDWWHPYLTMTHEAEALIARELMKFAMNGLLYRGSKPVMWSVVEKTALAEAEVEYQDYQSDTIFVKFPAVAGLAGQSASVVIWTTTPWTIPGNRAISFSPKISYGVYEVTKTPEGNWARLGDRYILADRLAADVMKAAKVEAFEKRSIVSAEMLDHMTCQHPLHAYGYDFDVPLLAGDHVTDDAGTGFVHTAPGHGTDDFEVWSAHDAQLRARGIDTRIPFTVDADGFLTKDAPGFEGKRVINDKGDKGDANDAVIKALTAADALIARGRLKHQYPHSWRSKKPLIYRNTPQWFIAMDREFAMGSGPARTLRQRALQAIADTAFFPPAGQNRLRGMVEAKPDWVLSRQRAWGVPISVFFNKTTFDVIPNPNWPHSETLMQRIETAFRKDGADAWFQPGAAEVFLKGLVDDPSKWQKVDDILDVWFESGCTHAFVLEQRADLKWPADLYLEGSDQHRGWFHSSLLESCGTRGRAPYDQVLTHGFIMAEDGRKMSKSLNNQVFPEDVIKRSGADILRLWVVSGDYSDDPRIGPEILKANSESYRKLRNTWRWLLGSLTHFEQAQAVAVADMPQLERLMLHRLAELDEDVRQGYTAYDFKRVFQALSNFCILDLSAFYFDIRKDALYCEPENSMKRLAALTVIDAIFEHLTIWLSPMLCFTAEEVWLTRHPSETGSVHLQTSRPIPAGWRDDALAAEWLEVRRVRSVVTGAIELERAAKRIGSSLEAAPVIYIDDAATAAVLRGLDLAELCITSGAKLIQGPIPPAAFTADGVRHVGVVVERAQGRKCERSWRITADVGSDPAYPSLSARDAAAVRQWDARHGH